VSSSSSVPQDRDLRGGKTDPVYVSFLRSLSSLGVTNTLETLRLIIPLGRFSPFPLSPFGSEQFAGVHLRAYVLPILARICSEILFASRGFENRDGTGGYLVDEESADLDSRHAKRRYPIMTCAYSDTLVTISYLQVRARICAVAGIRRRLINYAAWKRSDDSRRDS